MLRVAEDSCNESCWLLPQLDWGERDLSKCKKQLTNENLRWGQGAKEWPWLVRENQWSVALAELVTSSMWYACMCLYLCVCVCVLVCVRACAYWACMCMLFHVSARMRVYVCVCVLHVYLRVCVCVILLIFQIISIRVCRCVRVCVSTPALCMCVCARSLRLLCVPMLDILLWLPPPLY